MGYDVVEVMGAPEYHGLRVDHPRLLEYVKNGIRAGWTNERIGKVVGVPPSVIERMRARVKHAK